MANAKDVPDKYKYDYEKDYQEDWDLHRRYIGDFDAYEAMLVSQVYDSVSRSVDGSKITDSYTTTLAKERADRVAAKLPEGTTEPMGAGDTGKAAYLDILRQKWIYPNANAQHPFMEKVNMWEFYKSVYGYMPMFYDWNVSPSGYAGPDCWLWNPRNLVPQQGRTSIEDMDYVTALTWVSKKVLENLKGKPGVDDHAVDLLIELAQNEKTDSDQEKDTQVSRTRNPEGAKKGICLATRYEAGTDGKWCTFAPDHSCLQVREIPNPHKNGRIPFVINYAQPLFDSFYGLGDFQRAKPLQFARDGLTNFYFKGIKMNLIPPIVANANGVLKHTLDYREGGVMLETLPNSIRRLETSPAGLSTYQGAMSNLTGSLLSQFGSQNAAAPGAETLNPSQGKTPAAIDLYSNKEASRDGASLRHLEAALEQLTDGFNSLIVNIGTETIPVTMFAEDVKKAQESGVDFGDLFVPDPNGVAGTLKINPESLKGVEFRFNINPASTVKTNKQAALQGLTGILENIGKFQNLFKDDSRLDINFPRIMKAMENLSDIPGVGEFITMRDGPSPQEQAMQEQIKELEGQLQQSASAQQPEQPKQLLNYKDAPEDIKRQMEMAEGYQPSQGISPAGTEQAVKHTQAISTMQNDQLAQQGHELSVVQAADQSNKADQSHALAEKSQADSHEVAKKSATIKSKTTK